MGLTFILCFRPVTNRNGITLHNMRVFITVDIRLLLTA
jgi:hypothetical protein